MLLRYPRMVHAEFTRHRAFGYSVASSRAIPSAKLRKRIEESPATIAWWGRNQKGMAAAEELTGDDLVKVKAAWAAGMDHALKLAIELEELGLHKQIANRVLEPWMDVEQLTTGTDWSNFWALRIHPDAQPEIRRIAELAFEVSQASIPKKLEVGEWHLPFITNEDRSGALGFACKHNEVDQLLYKVSAARCARTSYLNHEGRLEYDKDLALFDLLVGKVPGHWSPTEHVAQAMPRLRRWDSIILWFAGCLLGVFGDQWSKGQRKRFQQHSKRFMLSSGNLVGWKQLRKFYDNENIGCKMP